MTEAWTRASHRLVSAAVLAAVLAASTTACGSQVSEDSLVGMALPALGPDDRVDGALVSFEGVLRIGPQGCLMVGLTDPGGDTADRWAVWPTGAEEVYGASLEAGNGVLVGGQQYIKDDPVTGTGRLVALEALSGGGEGGGYFRSSGTYCDALDGGVLVIDDLDPPVRAAGVG